MFNRLKTASLLLLVLLIGSMGADVLDYCSGTLYAGKTIPIGGIAYYLEYNATDTALKVTYETDSPWILSECHLWLGTEAPTQRGSPGLYPYNSGPINTQTYTFTIPISELRTMFGIDFCTWVYAMAHCEVYNDADGDGEFDCGETVETAYGGDNLVIPYSGQHAWFRYCRFHLTQPEVPPPNWTTFTPGFWKNHPEAFIGYLPVTVAGVTVSTQNQALAILSNPAAKVAWNSFLCHFLCLEFNVCYDPTLLGAYYNDLVVEGEFMENYTVGAIIAIANTYTSTTPRATLLAMKDVFDAINNNVQYRVLWSGPQALTVSLPNSAIFALSPNPFKDKTEIRFATGVAGTATIGIYDLTGKKVRDLTGNSLIWDGTDNNSKKLGRGVYILRLENSPERTTVKAIITK
jgi:hypothetical protein